LGLGFGISGVTVAGSHERGQDRPTSRFGFCPKISTPVENTVEKQVIHGKLARKT
jgi:hypothetical protein